MAQLELNNRYAYLSDVPTAAAKELIKQTSYLQAGYRHTAAWQGNYWDGRRRLVTMLKDGRLKVPAGLVQEAWDALVNAGLWIETVDKRKYPDAHIKFGWNADYALRPYQKNAVRKATKPYGPLNVVGRCILKLPPRSGKTVIAAAIIREFGIRSLVVVPSLHLLYQTRDALQKLIQCQVGVCGDSEWDPQDVTVASIQTLAKRRGKNTRSQPAAEDYLSLIRQSELVIWDEAHHLEAELWRKVMQDSGAAYKIGLTATAFLDHDKETELGVIWLRACAGEMLVDLSVSDLIEQGYLVKPFVKIYPVREPDDISKRGWSRRLHDMAILSNPVRNQLIVRVVGELVEAGRQVVVISNRLEQVGALGRLMNQTRIKFARLTGETPQTTRTRYIKRFQSRELNCLLGTVIGEGVDIPEIDAVVVAEGGQGIKATYQRLRCLTPCNGKESAVVVDFMDLMHPYFANHSLERLGVYRSERAFEVSVAR